MTTLTHSQNWKPPQKFHSNSVSKLETVTRITILTLFKHWKPSQELPLQPFLKTGNRHKNDHSRWQMPGQMSVTGSTAQELHLDQQTCTGIRSRDSVIDIRKENVDCAPAGALRVQGQVRSGWAGRVQLIDFQTFV